VEVCGFCGNKNFKEKRVQYIYKHDGHFLIVDNVPCEECEYCGEQYFKAEDLKKIEKDFLAIYSNKKKLRKHIEVPIEEFAELK
jgi:YgiT-type zinc finger domain-containing protein